MPPLSIFLSLSFSPLFTDIPTTAYDSPLPTLYVFVIVPLFEL